MKVPPQIQLRVRCAEADELSGLVFRMQITAGYRNSYGIFFPKTDLTGHTRLAAEEIEGQFTDHWVEGLMDYNGLIAEAKEIVTIRLWDPAPLRERYQELLAWPLLTYERTRWRSRRDYLDYMASCRNDEFTFDGISVRLPDTRLLYVSLRRAAARQAF
jgi:hypothetical protein